MPNPIIKLKSSDGEIFQLEVEVAKLSLHIKEMLDDLGVDENEVISIPPNAPKISGAILGKIIQWANHHQDDHAAAEDDEIEEKPTNPIYSWDDEFIQVDQTTLFQMIRAANYLNIKGLLDVTCKKVATMMKGLAVEDIRQRFNIRNDFSPDEEQQIYGENAWCERIDSEENFDRSVDENVMEKIPTNFVQDLDNEGIQVMEDCLNNSVVVREILQNFPNHELLELSLLNNMWNYEARILMKNRRNVTVYLQCGSNRPCQQVFEAFGVDLRQMNVVPFSGMVIEINPGAHTDQTSALDLTNEAIRDRMALKNLSVRLFGEWLQFKDLPALMLVKNVLQCFSGAFEELTLYIEEKREEFIEQFVQDCSFVGVKVLKLQEEYRTSDAHYTNYMKALVSRAPALQELHTDGSPNLMVNVLEERSAVLVHEYEVNAPFDGISESVLGALRLKDMKLFYTEPEFNLERFNRITPVLLRTSCLTTLCSVAMDSVLAVQLMCFGIGLEIVNKLKIYMPYDNEFENFEPRILTAVRNFDFTRIFPRLNKVKIWHTWLPEFSPVHLNAIIEQADAMLREPMMDRAANIKELHLKHFCFSPSTAPFYAQMFPNIQKITVLATLNREVPFGSIWEHWVDLEELHIEGSRLYRPHNLDSVFCGIFPEEVAELRQKDDEYLKKVNIVPVMPAIACLKNLRVLTFENTLCHPIDGHDEDDDGPFMFSKVTGLVALAKCPSLAVSLNFVSDRTPPEMSHLKPFASVTVRVRGRVYTI